MASKLIICLVLAALVGCAAAQWLHAPLSLAPVPGARDITGGYYDNYSGQYSSALTGRVYNTHLPYAAAPILAHRPLVAAAPLAFAHRPLVAAPIAYVK